MIDIGGLHIDATITAGTIIEIVTIACGGLYALSKLSTKFVLFAENQKGFKADIVEIKIDLKAVNAVLARTNENDRRIGRIEDLIYSLQRGDGWVTNPRRTSVNGEYPTPPNHQPEN